MNEVAAGAEDNWTGPGHFRTQVSRKPQDSHVLAAEGVPRLQTEPTKERVGDDVSLAARPQFAAN